MSEVNNAEVDHAKYTDVVMPIYNLIEYNENYFKTCGSLWQYFRDEPALSDAGTIDNFSGNSASFKFEQKIAGKTGADYIKNVKIMLPLTYLKMT